MPPKKQTPLSLSSPDVAAFVRGPELAPAPVAAPSAPAFPASAPVFDADAPPRAVAAGHVVQASGEVKRRLVVSLPADIGRVLDLRQAETGASLSRITADLLRGALGL